LPDHHRARYAVYYAPDTGSGLWRAASKWLGRDAAVRGPEPHSPPSELASPWLYGFHATLKPPMRLASGQTPSAFLAAVRRLAASRCPFSMPQLGVEELGYFLALTLTEPCAAMADLAAACVTELDEFRMPPSDHELQSRRQTRLTARQDELLERWGYPYVLDEWKFHMTLTSSILEADKRANLRFQIDRQFSRVLTEPVTADSVCVYVQESPGAPFFLEHRFPLGGAPDARA
jgi:putative phosphonate metabolism protein